MWSVPLTLESLICVGCAFDIGELDLCGLCSWCIKQRVFTDAQYAVF